MANLDTAVAKHQVKERIERSRRIFEEMADSCAETTARVAELVVGCLGQGGKVLFCGNGGSSMDAGHLAAELLGRFYRDREPLPAMSLADSTAAMTAIANDYAYAEVFARQVLAHGREGDVLVCLSTSGNSANVVAAIEAAKTIGVHTVALTGAEGGKVAPIVDICIRVPSSETPRIQEACMHLGHSICELAEEALFP